MAKLANAALWALLVGSVLLVIAMVWHPWVHPWTGVGPVR